MLADPVEAALRRVFANFRPPPKLDLATWMETHMRLPAGASAMPGRVRLHPWQRGIADAMSDPNIERVTVQKSARVGYSTLLIGLIGSLVDNEPAPVLCVLPTESDARSFVVDQVEPVFEATPQLRGKLGAEADESGRNTLLHRRYPGGSLKVVAAKSPRNLRAHTARVLIVDEAAAMEAGSEGDPISLAIRRTMTFANRKIVIGSTPVFEEGDPVIRGYAESDQRVFEVVPPCCETPTEIMWKHIEWPEGEPDLAAFRCPHCDALTHEKHKVEMVARGAWRITRPEVKGHAGFRLNSLCSTLPNASWGKLAAEFIAAKKSPDTLQTFVNTILGEGWREASETLDEADLLARAEEFGLQAIPEPVRVITAGVDVQRDRIEITFLGFSDAESFVLGHSVVWGDPKESTTWAEVDDALKTTWRHPLGRTLGVDAAAVDAGDGETMDSVQAFCSPRFNRRVVAIKGASGNRPAIEASHSKGSKLFIVGVDGIKASLLTRLARGRSIRFSNTLSAEWFEQLTSERRVLRYSRGQPVRLYERIMGRRAEALDCVVYALAVRNLVKVDLERRGNELRGVAEAPRIPNVVRSQWMERGRR
ncbi:MAG: phage terminase large subunit family protein [Hyphomonadaceae bacterium]|nr:phage terminase large subunit family protein [Hyphomonadaceae bacterium]